MANAARSRFSPAAPRAIVTTSRDLHLIALRGFLFINASTASGQRQREGTTTLGLPEPPPSLGVALRQEGRSGLWRCGGSIAPPKALLTGSQRSPPSPISEADPVPVGSSRRCSSSPSLTPVLLPLYAPFSPSFFVIPRFSIPTSGFHCARSPSLSLYLEVLSNTDITQTASAAPHSEGCLTLSSQGHPGGKDFNPTPLTRVYAWILDTVYISRANLCSGDKKSLLLQERRGAADGRTDVHTS